MTKRSVVSKIDFKISMEKKEQLKSYAIRNGVNVSYVMNELVDGLLQKQRYIVKRKELSAHLVRAIQASECVENEEVRMVLQTSLEGVQQCLM